MRTPIRIPATAEQRRWILDAFAALSLRHFNPTHGSFSADASQKMARMEAAIEFERKLMGWERDDGPRAA